MANYANVQAFTNRLTTELNSLADGAATAASANIDNSTNLYGFARVSVALAAINPTAAAARIEIHRLPRMADGTTYADVSATTRVASVILDTTGSNTKEGMSEPFSIPPGFYRYVVVNRTGVTLAASGSVIAEQQFDMRGA